MTKAEAWDVLTGVVIDDDISDEQYIYSLVHRLDLKVEKPKEEWEKRYGIGIQKTV